MEETVKTYLRSLLTSAPGGVQMFQLEKDYRNTIGESIPYIKLGYKSLEGFLKSIPETLIVRGSGRDAVLIPVITEKSAHINEMVARQRTAKGKRGITLPRNYVIQQPQLTTKKIIYPNRKSGASSSLSTPKVESKVPQSTSVTEFFERASNNSIEERNKLPSNTKPIRNSNFDKEATQYSNKVQNVSNNASLLNNSTSFVTSKTKLLRERINAKGKPTSSDCGQGDNYTQHQYNVAERDAENNVGNNNSFVFGITKKGYSFNSTHYDNFSSSTTSTFSVPINVQKNLKKLISNHPDGIWCAQLPTLYRRMFKTNLNYEEYGFRSLIELCSSLNTVFHYARPSKDDFRLYDRNRPLPENAEKKFTIASYSADEDSDNALPSIDWEDLLKFIPKDIFPPGSDIPRVFVPESTKLYDNFDINPGEVYDVSKFWVYFDNGVLDTLMNEIQEFYKYHHQKYQMPKQIIKEGVYCVQVIFKEYHRALIVDELPDVEDTIRVLYIDYGTVMRAPTKGLCFLHEEFAKVPAQAVRCRLANVVPVLEGAPWSSESTKCFRNLLLQKKLRATVLKINWEDQYLDIFLEDMSNPDKPFYINDRLVEEGHAQYPDKERKKYKIDSVYKCKVKQIHLFPTFTELERGLAPSSSEMAIYEQCCIPAHFAYPQYFEIDHTEEEARVASIDSFFQQNIRQTRDKQVYYYDVSKLKPKPLDFEYFGDLADEMREFAKTYGLNDSLQSSSCEQENQNDLDHNIQQVSTQLEIMEFAEKLKKDRLLAQDIMTELENIYHCDVSELNCDTYDPSEGFWSLDDRSERKFSEEELKDSNVVDDLIDLNLEDYLSIPPRSESSTSLENCDIQSHEPDNDTREVEGSERKLKCTNPFLEDIQNDSSDNEEITSLNPNNPFLTYQPTAPTDISKIETEEMNFQAWSTEDSRSESVKSFGECFSHVGGESGSDVVKDMAISSSRSDDSRLTVHPSQPQFSYPQHFSATNNYYGYGNYVQQPTVYPPYYNYIPPVYHGSAYSLARQCYQQTNYVPGLPYMDRSQGQHVATSQFSAKVPSSSTRPPPGFAPNSNIYQVNSVSHTTVSANFNPNSGTPNDFYELYNAHLRSTLDSAKDGVS